MHACSYTHFLRTRGWIVATSEDVARLAGVSRATVSRTLSGNARVNEDTRRRVEAAAASLGYVPDMAAQSLSGGPSRTIALGFFADDMWALSQLTKPKHYFYLNVLRSIEAGAAAAGYDLLLPSRPHEGEVGSLSYVRRLRARRVAGALMVACPPGDVRIQALVEARLPTVFIDVIASGPCATWVASENAEGAQAVTGHLISLGHRRIARITGTETDPSGGDRLRGIRAALAAAGIAEDPGLARRSDWSTEGAYQAAKDLLDRRPDLTAIVAESDMMAIGVLRALHEHGLRVPDDVSVTGFDDVDLSAYTLPSLTTVRQDTEAMGAGAVAAVLDLIDGPTGPAGRAPAPLRLPTELVVRGSTAPPRAD
jgi:DNA-binding LacI/PurR family transcriptional regulator